MTGTDLATSCTFPPASQGADGWVTKLPEGFDDGAHTVSVVGESTATYVLSQLYLGAQVPVRLTMRDTA